VPRPRRRALPPERDVLRERRMNARHEDVPLADIPRYTWLPSRYPNFLASFIRPFREVAVRRFCLAIEQPPRANGRSAWHGRPAGSAEVDAGRYRNGHDCGVPAGVAFPCTSLSGRRTVVAPRTLCTEATVSVAPGSLFTGGDHDHSNPARRPPETRPRATDR
jgi:hypothetical protein